MARRGRGRRRKIKFKLKKEAVYTLFAFGSLALSALLLLSLYKSTGAFLTVHDIMAEHFGWADVLVPFLFFFLGFLFLKLKVFFSQVHATVGFFILFFCLSLVSKAGTFGEGTFLVLSQMITDSGTYLVGVAGILVGIIVFFNTSVNDIVEFIGMLVENLPRLIPGNPLSFFKKKNSVGGNVPFKIKGGQKDIPSLSPATAQLKTEPVINKKEQKLLSETLVANPLEGGPWEYPPLTLLSDAPNQKADRGDVKRIAAVIESTLNSFGIEARVVEVNLGPAVTQYAIQLAQGTKVAKITSLANDLALATEAPTGQIRIEAPIPGRNLVGIEIPNRSLEVVTLKTMLASNIMQKAKSKLTIALGLDVSGNPVVADIGKMPHSLIAGTTGSGKSVLINAIISSLLYRASPSEVKLILVDPKRVEFTAYNGIPHLLTPVIVEVEKILSALKWAMGEMDRRYKQFAEQGVRNIDSYNELSGFQALPYIVIVVDELADLMMFAPVEVEDAIARLAQMARATGIHLVIATQRPSVNVITGLIKANIPCRIAFNVSSMIDSRVILDTPGAEKLLGRGDMLYVPPEQAKPTRIQGAFVSEKEVKKLVEFLKSKTPVVEYTEEVTSQKVTVGKGSSGSGGNQDDLFEQAIRAVCQYDRASASLLQRKLSVGYARAARIIDQLEAAGVVGHGEGSKPRDVLVKNPDEFLAAMQAAQ